MNSLHFFNYIETEETTAI